jgi:hypothetical protein
MLSFILMVGFLCFYNRVGPHGLSLKWR